MADNYWEIEIRHDGLGKYRHIRGSDKQVVEQKAHYQKLQWNVQWQHKLDADQRKAYKDTRKQEAEDRDAAAKLVLDRLRNTLSYALNVNHAFDWNLLKDITQFKEPPPSLVLTPCPENKSLPFPPTQTSSPAEPTPEPYPEEPQRDLPKYQPYLFIIRPELAQRRTARVQALFEADHADWLVDCKKCDQHHSDQCNLWREEKKRIAEINFLRYISWEREVKSIQAGNIVRRTFWENQCALNRSKHPIAMSEWESRKNSFYKLQRKKNDAIDRKLEVYEAHEPDAVKDYCDSVLSNSEYPDFFPKEWDLEYMANTRTLVVEYALPAPETLPTIKEVQYIRSKDSFKEVHLSDRDRDVLYDNLLYQIAIRTLHEIFESDNAGDVDTVVFNGLVNSPDKNSGHNIIACVLSVQARKEAFVKINLVNIIPKACFISLKGVAASKLVGLTPISPVLTIDKTDRRFVDGYAVANSIHAGTNLAAMNWEDFEHLIREIFEKEFAAGGGEVKVTKASRDGGVDAVAFDPDPIRGGKIVIQAKRYTNTVGVSAVRDLYGTVINEGATKGVLVTTANYGPDAYEFAQGKPLTLLNGSNLLHLLEKHGHHARINLQEAKLFK